MKATRRILLISIVALLILSIPKFDIKAYADALPSTKTVSMTVTLSGVHSAADFPSTKEYNDGTYAGTLIRQDDSLVGIVRSHPVVTQTLQSDTTYPTDKPAAGQYAFPVSVASSYHDSVSGQNFPVTLSPTGSPYFSGNPETKYLYWDHRGYQYDPQFHTTLGWMSNNPTTYSGSYLFSNPPRAPSTYYGPSGEANLGWVQYKAPTWDGALQDAEQEPWRSICIRWDGVARFTSVTTGVYNRYRKPVHLYYRRSAVCKYICQEYSGTAAVTDTQIIYSGDVSLIETPPDLTVIDANTENWYAGTDVLVSARVFNFSSQPMPSVLVRLVAGSITVDETIPVPGDGSNLAVFRFTVPIPSEPLDSMPLDVTIIVDPNCEIDEANEGNNSWAKTQTVSFAPSPIVIDPDSQALEQYHLSRNKVVPALPQCSPSAYHVWQEVRLENGNYVVKNFWAQLDTVFNISPDPRIAYPDNPDLMESGFGVQAYCTTTLTTNYDHPEKLVGSQMVWVYYPESDYGQGQWQNTRDDLVTSIGEKGDNIAQWQLAVNPYSATGSRLHYAPLWFPDGQYIALMQAFYAWSPVGQMLDYSTDDVTIDGDMYDRITVVRGR